MQLDHQPEPIMFGEPMLAELWLCSSTTLTVAIIAIR